MKKIIVLLFILAFSCCKENQPNSKSNTIEKHSDESVTENSKPINSELIKKLILTDVNLKCRGNGTRAASVYGSGVTIYFTITNNTEMGVSKVFFNGKFKFKGRSYEYSEDINYEFEKGLEPGETLKIAMRPGLFSKWNDKIKPGNQGSFILNTIAFENYQRKRFE